MKKHFMSHFNLPRSVCRCGKMFTKVDNLKKHVKRALEKEGY